MQYEQGISFRLRFRHPAAPPESAKRHTFPDGKVCILRFLRAKSCPVSHFDTLFRLRKCVFLRFPSFGAPRSTPESPKNHENCGEFHRNLGQFHHNFCEFHLKSCRNSQFLRLFRVLFHQSGGAFGVQKKVSQSGFTIWGSPKHPRITQNHRNGCEFYQNCGERQNFADFHLKSGEVLLFLR